MVKLTKYRKVYNLSDRPNGAKCSVTKYLLMMNYDNNIYKILEYESADLTLTLHFHYTKLKLHSI